MNNKRNDQGCAARCWRLAGYAGLAFAVLFMLIGGVGLISAAIAGVVVFGLLGFAMSRFLCSDAEEGETNAPSPEAIAPVSDPAPQVEAAPESVSTPEAETLQATDATPSVETADEAVSAKEIVKPSKVLPGQVELASRKGNWRYDPSGKSA